MLVFYFLILQYFTRLATGDHCVGSAGCAAKSSSLLQVGRNSQVSTATESADESGTAQSAASLGEEACCDVSVPYVASALENNVTLGDGCLADALPLMQAWLAEIEDRELKDTRVFSRQCVPGVCKEQLLEPLAFNLRDPRIVCPSLATPGWDKSFEAATGDMHILSKAFLAPSMSLPSIAADGRVLLFDLGASVYNGSYPAVPRGGELNGWGASGKWFVDEFSKRGLPFNHLYLWEANTDETQYRAAGLTAEYADKITFYHVEVKSEGAAPQNALRILRDKCQKRDYCVLKVDFDEPDVENAIVQAVVRNDGGVRDLVDEFFWDPVDHNVAEMRATLLQLRERGVRAHSWV